MMQKMIYEDEEQYEDDAAGVVEQDVPN